MYLLQLALETMTVETFHCGNLGVSWKLRLKGKVCREGAKVGTGVYSE